MMPQGEIWKAIRNERDAQDVEWGASHDDQHSLDDWHGFIHHHSLRAARARDQETARTQLVRVVALAVAAIESLDRKSLDRKTLAASVPAADGDSGDVTALEQIRAAPAQEAVMLQFAGWWAGERRYRPVLNPRDTPSHHDLARFREALR